MEPNRNVANLTALIDPDEDDVIRVLKHRFGRGVCYTLFGDGVIAINPNTGWPLQENSPENGRLYCSKTPMPNLPPHVYKLAHEVYREILHGVSPHGIFISGASGSGKTEVSEMLLSHFFREASVSPTDNVPSVLLKGLSALKRLTTFKSQSGPTSSGSSTVVTLYFGDGGILETAKIKNHLLNPGHSTVHDESVGHLNIFYDIIAALYSGSPGLSVNNTHGVLQKLRPSLTSMDPQMLEHHMDNWFSFVDLIRTLDIGKNQQQGMEETANTFLDTVFALMLLATLQFDLNPQTRQARALNGENFVLAASLVGVPGQELYNALETEAARYDAPPPTNMVQACDQLVHELYSRLVKYFEKEINNRLPNVNEGETHGVVHIADLPSFDDRPIGTLEILCQNMAAEHIEMFINKTLVVRENEALKMEGLKINPVKRQKCEDICELAFSLPGGLLNQLESKCCEKSITDAAIVSSLDKDFKKNKDIYTGSKKLGPAVFSINHSYKQVTYSVNWSFRQQNLIIPNRKAQSLLAASNNETVREVFEPAIAEFQDPHKPSHFFLTTFTQVNVKALIDQLYGSVPHLIRCIKPCPAGQIFEPAFVKPQVKSAYLPDLTHHKKYHFSHWMTLGNFLQRYWMLIMPLSTGHPVTVDSCKSVLHRVGILEKGPVVTKRLVFLMYWHKENLDTLVDSFIWKVTLIQANIRKHLIRKMFQKAMASRLRSHDRRALYGNSGRDSYGRPFSADPYWATVENQLFEDIITNTDDRIAWCKVFYMEQGTVVAKAYAEELSLSVTGFSEPFDQLELGLAYTRNPNRLRETDYIIDNLEQGIELRRDSDGSLWARRLSEVPFKVYYREGEAILSADMLRCHGQLPLSTPVKVFDMQEFRSLISLEMKNKTFARSNLQKRCITAICIGRNDGPLMRLPCWLAVVNINALNILDDDKELESISLLTSQLALKKTEEDELEEEKRGKQEEAKQRRQRKQWSKSDQRDQLKMKEQNARKIRQDLRKRGEKISDHMKYSWEEKTENIPMTMDQLFEEMKRGNTEGGPYSPTSPTLPFGQKTRQWAKVDVALRYASRELLNSE